MQNESLRKSLALAKHVAYEAHRNDFDMLTVFMTSISMSFVSLGLVSLFF